jgi:trans-aconitate methyltransferase
MIRLARERHPTVSFHHADIRTWETARRYDFITAWDSIWHVPLADQIPVIAKLCGFLEPGGVLLFTAGGLEEPSAVRDDPMGVPMYHATAGIPYILKTLNDAGCACRHLEYDQWPERHVVIVAQKNAPTAL